MGWRRKFEAERDRRYGEVATERDKALALAREIQNYKDEKANDLRSQIDALLQKAGGDKVRQGSAEGLAVSQGERELP